MKLLVILKKKQIYEPIGDLIIWNVNFKNSKKLENCWISYHFKQYLSKTEHFFQFVSFSQINTKIYKNPLYKIFWLHRLDRSKKLRDKMKQTYIDKDECLMKCLEQIDMNKIWKIGTYRERLIYRWSIINYLLLKDNTSCFYKKWPNNNYIIQQQ